MKALLSYSLIVVLALCVKAQALEIRYENRQTQLFFYLDGKIERGDAAKFKAAWYEAYDPAVSIVGLNSPGGDMDEGMEIGRFLREKKATTIIVDIPPQATADKFMDILSTQAGEQQQGGCYSSCANAFMGGVKRIVPLGSKIGFHQFSYSNKDLATDSVSMNAQIASSNLSLYLSMMGANPILFNLLSTTLPQDMFIPEHSDLLPLGITTSDTFNQFELKMNGGVVGAVSKNPLNVQDYELVEEVELMCAGGLPSINLYAKDNKSGLADYHIADVPSMVSGWELVTDSGIYEYGLNHLKMFSNSKLLATMYLDRRPLHEILNGQFTVRVNAPRAAGYFISAKINSPQSKELIKHALNQCM